MNLNHEPRHKNVITASSNQIHSVVHQLLINQSIFFMLLLCWCEIRTHVHFHHVRVKLLIQNYIEANEVKEMVCGLITFGFDLKIIKMLFLQ
jgi:hypothetical protein